MTTQPTLDPLDLGPIEAREAAATKGPWFADGHEILVGTADDITRRSTWIGETCTTELPDWGAANAEFAAHARTDIPALVARVRELEAELATAEQQTVEMTRCRDAALRALHRDDIETDIDVEEAITNALHGPGWDWEDPRTPGQIAREVAPAIRPALAKATQQIAVVVALADRWDNALGVDKSYGRALRSALAAPAVAE